MSAHCAPEIPNNDRMIYFVLVDYGPKLGKAWAERDAGRVNLKDTISDIRTGDLSHVIQVIEINIAEIISRDVTEDVLRAAGKWDDVDPPLFGTARVDWLHDHARDHRKHEVA